MDRSTVEQLAAQFGTPLYVYEAERIQQQARRLRAAFAPLQAELHYALKANPNPALLKLLLAEGLGLDAVSPFEVQLGLDSGFAPHQILFTGNHCSPAELAEVISKGVPINVGSLGELESYGSLASRGEVAIRINPDVGAGHHRHVITGGRDAKFGIPHTAHEAVQRILVRHRLRLIGLHAHIGTGILDAADMLRAMEVTLAAAEVFGDRNLRFIDFGGGFGIPYREGQQPLDLEALAGAMCRRFAAFRRESGRSGLRMKLEPGRFLVAEAGSLLTRVTNLHQNQERLFVGTDSGFHHLLRPALYGAYHRITNPSAEMPRSAGASSGEPRALREVIITGNICESGDVFTQGAEGIEVRPLPEPRVGDVLRIADCGAYGMALASNYNLRPRPAEVLCAPGAPPRLIRRRETYADLTRCFVDEAG